MDFATFLHDLRPVNGIYYGLGRVIFENQAKYMLPGRPDPRINERAKSHNASMPRRFL
jgi:hypothetical protein